MWNESDSMLVTPKIDPAAEATPSQAAAKPATLASPA
jgi:hypothetical protein